MYRAYRLLKQARTFQSSLCPRGFGSEAKTVLFDHAVRHVYSLQHAEHGFLFHEIYSRGKVRRVNITRVKRREMLKDDTHVTSHMC